MPVLPEHEEFLLLKNNSQTLPKASQKEQSNSNINQDYFKIWGHNMAYIFGFWYAKGCIYGEKIFDITIHAKDKYLIKQFAKELRYKGPIYDYVDKQVARLNFSCAVIYNDIKSLGGEKEIFPNVPKEYLSDFVRGYFDGNGSIMRIKRNRINLVFTCENKKFIDTLWHILIEEAGIEGGSYNPLSVSLKFGKKDSIKIGAFMYKNNPELFLLRKKQKFDIP